MSIDSVMFVVLTVLLSFVSIRNIRQSKNKDVLIPKKHKGAKDGMLLIIGLFVLVPSMLITKYNVVKIHTSKNDKVDPVSFQRMRKEMGENSLTIRETNKNDKVVLEELISNQDEQFNNAFVDIFGNSLSHELLEFGEKDLSFTIVNPDKEIVGQILFSAPKNDCMNVSYWIDKSSRKKGYASEALKLAIKDVLNRNPGVTLAFEIAKENIASIKTLEKACNESNVLLDKIDQSLECRVDPINNEGLNYKMEIYNTTKDQANQNPICKYEISKDQLSKITSQKNIDSGFTFKQERILYRVFKD